MKLKAASSLLAVCCLQQQRAAQVAWLMRLGMFFPAYWVIARAPQLSQALLTPGLSPLWPAAWVPFGASPAVAGGLLAALFLSLLVGAFWARQRWARVLGLVALLVALAIGFSYGKIHHLMHGWVMILALWVCAPHGWDNPQQLDRAGRQQLLVLFAAGQWALGATYSLAGCGKLVGALVQAAAGQPHAFVFDAFPRHIASRISQTGELSVLGPALIELGAYSWPIWLVVLYVQVFGVVFATRPVLQRGFGLFVCAFHGLSALVLTIDFSPNVLLAALMLVASPFARRGTVAEVVAALPVVGRGLGVLVSRTGR